jgi:hypothetical protein
VVTVAGHAGLNPGPWWSLAFRWWVLYSLCGLLLGVIAALTQLGREEAPAVVEEPIRFVPPERTYRPAPPPIAPMAPIEEEPVSPIPVTERPDDPGATAG